MDNNQSAGQEIDPKPRFLIIIAVWIAAPVILYAGNTTTIGAGLLAKTALLILLFALTGWILAPLLRVKQPSPRPYPQLLMILVALSFSIYLTFVMDSLFNRLVPEESLSQGLLFIPDTTIDYETTEFSYTARINNFGFRGDDARLESRVDCRVLLLGDSFTWGWGVDQEIIWATRLEQMLQDAGHDVEVLNLGLPGAGTGTYAALAQTAIPLFKPDVVVVGVLQGQDLMQALEEVPNLPRQLDNLERIDNPVPAWNNFLIKHYPALARIFLSNADHIEADQTTIAWIAQTERILGLHPDVVTMFESFDEEAQTLYKTGQLNPGLLYAFAWKEPDHFVKPTDLQDPDIQTKIAAMSQHLTTIAELSPKVLVISVPYGLYIEEAMLESRRKIGIEAPDFFLTTTAVDEATKSAIESSEARNITFLEVTEPFRNDSESKFFYWDGHFNEAGHALFADLIWEAVGGQCPGAN